MQLSVHLFQQVQKKTRFAAGFYDYWLLLISIAQTSTTRDSFTQEEKEQVK